MNSYRSIPATAAAVICGALMLTSGPAEARDQIRIVGSSTVYPFATAVAEQFGRSSSFKSPVVESTGSGGGLKLFCAGVGEGHPDITNSSRRIKESEVKQCADNGAKEITEVKVGFDGIVLANSRSATLMKLELSDIFLALAREVPVKGKMVPNPYKTWKEVNANLPDLAIRVLGPPPTSGTRDAFVELAMEGGCSTFPEIKAEKKDEKKFKALCHSIREDGAYVEAGENDNLIVQKLVADPQSLGIFGYSFLDQNQDRLQGSVVGEVAPTFDNIASGKYPVSRSLYVYVKKAHVGMVPGIKEFLGEFTSERAWGEEGYLAERGLIPMPAAERERYRKDAAELNNLKM
ncbi:MAG: PstS family phosphate ABC transporter substrate-binding protein [Magnetococcales bacterium]|nr:PstS family phosphate ABC transporter substrate-binding protein [Magnetococcales bacterium]